MRSAKPIVSSTSYIIELLRSVSRLLKSVRLFFNGVGIAAIAVGQTWMTSGVLWEKSASGYLFWFGVAVIVVTGLVLALFEKDNVSLIVSLSDREDELDRSIEFVHYLQWKEHFLLSWQAVNTLLSELIDQAIVVSPITDENKSLTYTAVVEILAEFKSSLFMIGEEYCNISIYRFNNTSNLLECIACYRSRPSDANVEHRSWAIGEGHVGKAFELQRELICGDANSLDVKPWISAPPAKLDERDEKRYVSLAAVPIAVNAESPMGVLIVTSSEPMRFMNGDEGHFDEEEREKRRVSVAAIQDFATQISRIMAILDLREGLKQDEEG